MLVGDRHGLTGIVEEQSFARRMGLPHRQRQALAPIPVVPTERTVLVAVGLLGLVLLPEQVERDAFAAQAVMNLRPFRPRALHRRWLAGREQQAVKHLLINFRRKGVTQAGYLGTRQVVADSGWRSADDAGDFPLGTAEFEEQPEDF